MRWDAVSMWGACKHPTGKWQVIRLTSTGSERVDADGEEQARYLAKAFNMGLLATIERVVKGMLEDIRKEPA